MGMAAKIHFICLLFFIFDLCHPISGYRSNGREEEFTEELLLKPLPDKKLLSHFHFESFALSSVDNGRHHHLFPKAIAQLVKKFHVKELELSFTQGRWNYRNWGGLDPMSSANAKPPGVELWAHFDLPNDEIDATWKNLTHALSGLFCSSINFLESSTAYSSPNWGFSLNSTKLRYGALPREAVCTENLTPWLKLLPCRDKAGLASLLDRPSIYRGYYHSQRLRISSSELDSISLKQSLTLVLRPSVKGLLQPSWSISSLFRKRLGGHCTIAKSSKIYLELERGLVSELEKQDWKASSDNVFFELTFTPDKVIKEQNSLLGQANSTIYAFNVGNYSKYEPIDVGMKWKNPLVWSTSQSPYHVNRFLMGSGNERGSIAMSLQSSHSYEWNFNQSSDCKVQVIVFQVVPWYVKVYYHTLQIFVDGKPQIVSNVIENLQVSPSEDKVSPGILEMKLIFPCSMKSATLALDFDKGFLHINEYPPDANQGFDIPSALISFPDFFSNGNYLLDDISFQSPLLQKFKENHNVHSYTEVLLVPLTTPDFSMPYNVITFVCTILALYFGSLLNVLRRRVGEEERLLKLQGEKKGLIPLLLTKLICKLKGKPQEPSQSLSFYSQAQKHKTLLKVVFVAAAAVCYHYLSNDN